MSEILQFTVASAAQGTGRYTVAAHTETIIDGYQQNKWRREKDSPKWKPQVWCSLLSALGPMGLRDQTPGRVTASALEDIT